MYRKTGFFLRADCQSRPFVWLCFKERTISFFIMTFIVFMVIPNIWRHKSQSINHSMSPLTYVFFFRALHEVTKKRGFVVGRSTFVGSGQYGAHWLGDNRAFWSHLRHSVVGILEFNLFGIPFVGSDICGFSGNTTSELCRQWSRVGAFYPYCRNHNEVGSFDQDPAIWLRYGHKDVMEAAKSSLRMRYSLLHYLYTLFFHSNTRGGTVARPLSHEWPEDKETHRIDKQFLWGKNLLISPFLFEVCSLQNYSSLILCFLSEPNSGFSLFSTKRSLV